MFELYVSIDRFRQSIYYNSSSQDCLYFYPSISHKYKLGMIHPQLSRLRSKNLICHHEFRKHLMKPQISKESFNLLKGKNI